jgi:hypothetical protein
MATRPATTTSAASLAPAIRRLAVVKLLLAHDHRREGS